MDDFQTIYLNSDDDIASVIDCLSGSEAKNLILVIPKEADILSGAINLQLLKREAENLDKNIFIATTDQTARYLAKQVGIELADGWAKENSWRGARNLKSRAARTTSISQSHSGSVCDRDDILAAPETRGRRPMADIVAPSKQVSTVREVGPVFRETIEPVVGAVSGAEEAETGDYRPLLDENLPETDSVDQIEADEFSKEQPIFQSKESLAEEELSREPSPRTYEILKNLQPIERGEVIKKERKGTQLAGWKKKIIFGFIATAFIVAAAYAYYIFPRAEVVITVKKESVPIDITIIADKNITKTDVLTDKIPVQVIKIEAAKNGIFPVSGEQNLSEKARGVITVFNAHGSSSQGLVQNTRFISVETGKLFRTTKSVIIPGATIDGGKIIASSVEIEVVADQPGPDYNIGPSNFTIPGFRGGPKYSGFYGKSSSSMRGGAAGKAKVVSQDDLDRARAELIGSLKQELNQNLQKQIPGGFKLLNEAVKEGVPEITFSHQAGEAVDKFTVNVKSRNTAIVFSEQNINELADDKIRVSWGQNAAAIAGSRKITYNSWQIDFSRGVIDMNVGVVQDVTRKIDVEKLKQNLAGRNETEIRKVLSKMQEIQDAKVVFWPFWVKGMPFRVDKIKVTLLGDA
ncbi:MAG: hypothetical protein HY813_00320 [Candidatus Portnoybacteria bacterium]|nr:hypothetical protein [Candidatus Portnoybacteria bacterium]